MRKKHQMQHFSKTFKLCTNQHKQSQPVGGNENNDIEMPPKARRIQWD